MRRFFTLAAAIPVLLVVSLVSRVSADELTRPRPDDRQVTLIVTSLVEREHISGDPIDDTKSQRLFRSYLERLDPLKIYFLQSDIDEFLGQEKSLDDQLKQRDITFAYEVFRRFLERVDEAVLVIDALLEKELDFTVDEYVVLDPDHLAYPASKDEASDRWRRRIKYDLLSLKADDVERQEARKRLTSRYHDFQKRMHQTDADELLEWYLTAAVGTFDPHTTFFSPSTLADFRIRLGLNYQGIGAELEERDGMPVIRRILPGGAAEKAGQLKPKDRIMSVGQGDEGQMVDVVDKKLREIIDMIRGKEGTVVRLGVVPEGETETRIYKITRARIELRDSEARGEVIEVGQGDADRRWKIGVIDLPSFYMDMEGARRDPDNYKSTTRDVRRLLEDFQKQNVDCVILDLRRNGGGSLTEAINLTGLFIDTGPVVQVKDPDGRVEHYDDTEAGMAWDGPLVVLTSKFSASASEILAGAIQDYRRGLIIGDASTHGKGTVQSLLDLGQRLFGLQNAPNLGALKITIQQFYRPNGDSTQNRGVLADVELPSLSNHIAKGESELEYALKFDQVPKADYAAYELVDAAFLPRLREASQQRREQSADFAKLLKNIERFETTRQRIKIPLQEEKFFAFRQSDEDQEQAADAVHDEPADKGDVVVKRDFYFNEVLAVTADYLRLLAETKLVGSE